jgi:hypothetical protein
VYRANYRVIESSTALSSNHTVASEESRKMDAMSVPFPFLPSALVPAYADAPDAPAQP